MRRGVDGFSLGILRGEEGKPSATPKPLIQRGDSGARETLARVRWNLARELRDFVEERGAGVAYRRWRSA
jgi:hypothetical protein